MKRGSFFGGVGLVAGGTLALVFLLASGGTTGEYHTGTTLLCYDCHTMHFSMQHGFGGGPVSATATAGGNWLGTGPNEYLLKAPANDLCLACHDGRGFAPDVLGDNFNAAPSQGREAGALNNTTGTAPYQTWKGHTLGSPTVPPGNDPTKIGADAGWYVPGSNGLQCISCHAAHGTAGAYRNLGPVALTPALARTNATPSYVISNSNTTTMDVWINLGSYTAGSGEAVTFNPYYDFANIRFNRNDFQVGTAKTSNKIDTLCGACHGVFHGGPGDGNIGGTPGALNGFLRHPTSQVTIGASTFANHSDMARFQANTTKVKVYSTTDYSNATPGCVSCHKGHGNQNPFGLVFLNGSAASVTEEGGYATGQTQDLAQGYRNLCGQCHSQGN